MPHRKSGPKWGHGCSAGLSIAKSAEAENTGATQHSPKQRSQSARRARCPLSRPGSGCPGSSDRVTMRLSPAGPGRHDLIQERPTRASPPPSQGTMVRPIPRAWQLPRPRRHRPVPTRRSPTSPGYRCPPSAPPGDRPRSASPNRPADAAPDLGIERGQHPVRLHPLSPPPDRPGRNRARMVSGGGAGLAITSPLSWEHRPAS
jgi:hypothetical protein